MLLSRRLPPGLVSLMKLSTGHIRAVTRPALLVGCFTLGLLIAHVPTSLAQSDEDLEAAFSGEDPAAEDRIFEPCTKFFQEGPGQE